MRVISGKYKGSKIDGFNIGGTRPTMDRVKESVFAMIQMNIKNSICLDLFAGSGNLGIEALSNGSKKVYFVDKNEKATKYISNNLKRIGINEEYEIMTCDYDMALKRLCDNKEKFDIVFLDPPYKLNFINEVLKKLVNMDLLRDGALIVCEYDKEEVESNVLTLIKMKKYGDKYIRIYKK